MTLPLFPAARPTAPRIAIVGTRTPTFQQIARVFALVAGSPSDTTIVSGGAPGIDTWAKRAAFFYRRAFAEHLPNIDRGMTFYEKANKLRDRNRRVVLDAWFVEALPGPAYYSRKGGTYNAVTQARRTRVAHRVWDWPSAGWDD